MDTRFGVSVNRRSQQAAGLVCLWNGAAGQRELIGGDDLTRNSSTSCTPGMLGPAWAFSGSTNERLYTAAAGQHNLSTEASWFAWMRYTGSGVYAKILEKDEYPSNRCMSLYINSNGTLAFYIFSSNLNYSGIDSVTWANDKGWHHIGMTYRYVADNTSILRAYVDGKQVGEVTNARGPVQNVTTKMNIGCNGRGTPAEPFYGQIAEARIYNRRVSAAEVSRMHNPATRFDLYRRPHSIAGAYTAPPAGQPMMARRGWSISTPRTVAGRF